MMPKCEQEVIEQLFELRNQSNSYLHQDGFVAEDEFFFAEQNARIAKYAEEYYHSMFQYDVQSWNLRDRHMAETLTSLSSHMESQGRPAKIVIWEHNSHLGDARATEMYRRGEFNVGQLVRQRYGEDSILVGFTTYSGTVTAAMDWGGPAERKDVRPALTGSVEALFHAAQVPDFSLVLDSTAAGKALLDLRKEMLERAIGVIYRPETEHISHFFHARLMDQFNAVIHFDETRAVEPLERTPGWEQGEPEPPETYPTGI